MFELLQICALILSFISAATLSDARYCVDDRFSDTCAVYGLQIREPFWIASNYSSRRFNIRGCRPYPGFEIKCQSDKPRMNISNHLYYVRGLSSSYITLVDTDVEEGQECPQPRHNFSLQSQPFLVLELSYSIEMRLFYNCTLDPESGWYQIACLENSYHNNKTRRSYAFNQSEIPKEFDHWYNYCQDSVVLPTSYISTNYTYKLISGFHLGWSFPVNCNDCLNSGGKCSANQTTGGISCQCPDGTTRLNRICQDDVDCNDCMDSGGECSTNQAIGGITCQCPDGTKYLNEICPAPDIAKLLAVDCDDCLKSGGKCSANQTTCQCPGSRTRLNKICPDIAKLSVEPEISIMLKVIIGVSIGFRGLLLIILLIYRNLVYSLYNRILKIETPTNVEGFLENYGCPSLQRYKYLDVKKMTNTFRETLGQGGYRTVYKGKLRGDCLVAVKVLNESKGTGEDFVNEVAAIGRTNHVNVVSLLGFCAEGNKRALVYELMSNGSLEKFIYNNQQSSTTTTTPLGWEKLYHIALGVAKGLEYLHRGCNTRILHLDIKPHNILLDQKFCPKISDFGLAKLCPTLASLVSIVGARGTPGYIAPEVYCRIFGGVSHKSDVYSYGMMLLEMIGGRKNIDAAVTNISEIYFPHWIYNHLEQGNKLHASEECKIEGSEKNYDDEKAKKMIIVALWCIQAHPIDRPSMRKVAEMLEGDIEEL